MFDIDESAATTDLSKECYRPTYVALVSIKTEGNFRVSGIEREYMGIHYKLDSARSTCNSI